MTDAKRIYQLIALLSHRNSDYVCTTLLSLGRQPSGSPDLLPYLEALTSDTRVAMIHYQQQDIYGGLNTLAGWALAAEHFAQSVSREVRVANAFDQLSADEIARLAAAAELAVGVRTSSRETSLVLLRQLLDAGVLPLYDLVIDPYTRVVTKTLALR